MYNVHIIHIKDKPENFGNKITWFEHENIYNVHIMGTKDIPENLAKNYMICTLAVQCAHHG